MGSGSGKDCGEWSEGSGMPARLLSATFSGAAMRKSNMPEQLSGADRGSDMPARVHHVDIPHAGVVSGRSIIDTLTHATYTAFTC